jgi:hypothetical protein
MKKNLVEVVELDVGLEDAEVVELKKRIVGVLQDADHTKP